MESCIEQDQTINRNNGDVSTITPDNDQIPIGTPRKIIVNPKNLAIKVAGAAIFGALSIVVSVYTTGILPRATWGIAYFDPVSIIWMPSLFNFWI